MKAINLEQYASMDPAVREYFPHGSARRYQADLANQVYRCLRAGAANIVVECPTGLGMAG